MNLKKLFSFCFIVCTLALSALLFCFPASAKTYDVSSDELFSKALDEAVDGDVINVNSKVSLSKDINKKITINTAENDIIIQGDLTLENVTINGRIRVLKGNKLTIGNQAVLSYTKSLSNTLNINEGSAVLDGGIISFDGENANAVFMTKGKFEFISGKITTHGYWINGIYMGGGDLSMSGGEIITSGRSSYGIVAGQHERVGSNVTITGGSIIANGEETRALSIHNSSNLIMTKGTAYGEKEALYVIDASATVIHPAKLRSVNLQKVSSERAKVYIDPICEYYNPNTDAVSSLKMDIISDDIITLDINDIANKDLFYFDIPKITDQFAEFQIYDALDENNALAYAEVEVNPNSDNKKHSGELLYHSEVIEIFINIKLFYNNKLEEKQIKVVLFQPDFAGIRIEPDVKVGNLNKEYYPRSSLNIEVYDACKSLIVSLPEGIENNRIKSFEMLDKLNTNVSYKKLGNNKYKVDLTTSPVSEQPSIRLKIQFKDGNTIEDRFYFIKIVYKAFNDIDNSYAKMLIEFLTSRGLYSWIEGDSFNPTRDITRAEFLYLVVNALKLDTAIDDNFDDVKETDYYYQAIGTAKKLGITKGVGNNNYGVNQGITRQDMSTILVNALKTAGVSWSKGNDVSLESFTDKDKIAAYARSSLAILVEEDILVGHNNILDPEGSFSMQQAAVVIYKIYKGYTVE